MPAPVIIEAAINGGTPKTRNPTVPHSTEEIVADALDCLAAGASVIHNHITLTNVSGEVAAAAYLDAWRQVLAQRPDALWYPTVNIGAPLEERYDHVPPLAESGLLRISLSDPGSVNFGRLVDGIPRGATVYTNSFDEIAMHMELCHRYQLGLSVACYEPGFLRTALAYHRAGQLPAGTMIKLYFCGDEGLTGTHFGLPPTLTALEAYLELLDGTGLPWAASLVGGDLVESGMADLALERGGHLHVGLEFYRGPRTPTNVELVRAAVAACEKAGRPVASSDEASAILGLPRSGIAGRVQGAN